MSLSYTITPFHPTISYTGQVKTELELANQNFTTLAQAFINQDPTSLTVVHSLMVGGYGVSSTPAPNTLLPLDSNGQFPSSINVYANPVNLSSATADYSLPVGAVAYISFTNSSIVPLHISTTNITSYEMYLVSNSVAGWNNWIYLYPNNTGYGSAFYYMAYYVGNYTGAQTSAFNAFVVGVGVPISKVFITNMTTSKNVMGMNMELYTSNTLFRSIATHWNDTTTSWTSLGTIVFPQATSGYILVRRLV